MSTFAITVVLGGIGIAVVVVMTRQKLSRLRQTVENNWQPLERHLKRRNEIIAKIAEVAEAHFSNDPNTIDDVQSLLDTLSGDLTIDQHVEFQNRLAQTMRHLLLSGDGMYELRNDSRYFDLKRQLGEADLQVTQAARFYNVSAKEYNEVCGAVPWALVAGYLGFGKQPYLATSLSESETPEFGR